MAKTITHSWDIARFLESDEDTAAYLDAALEEDDPAFSRQHSATSPAPKG